VSCTELNLVAVKTILLLRALFFRAFLSRLLHSSGALLFYHLHNPFRGLFYERHVEDTGSSAPILVITLGCIRLARDGHSGLLLCLQCTRLSQSSYGPFPDRGNLTSESGTLQSTTSSEFINITYDSKNCMYLFRGRNGRMGWDGNELIFKMTFVRVVLVVEMNPPLLAIASSEIVDFKVTTQTASP
jgi:hypothetical protein